MSKECNYPSCDRRVSAKLLCAAHYAQKIRGEILRPLRGTPQYYEAKLDDKGRKQCGRCSRYLEMAAFHRRTDAGINCTTRSICRRCNIVRRMNMTAKEYDEMLDRQKGVCAICGVSSSLREKSLGIDHDHRCCPGTSSCGECVRGLLCDDCNSGIGYFHDNPQVLVQAAQYLLGAAPGACPVK